CRCAMYSWMLISFFFQAEDGIRDWSVTGVQTCALPISTTTPRPEDGRQRTRADSPAAPISTVTHPMTRLTSEIRLATQRKNGRRSEERRVGKESRTRWWPYE